MVNTALNFVSDLSLTEIFVKSISPGRFTKNLEDVFALVDTLLQDHTVGAVQNFSDVLALSDALVEAQTLHPIKNFIDGLAIGEVLGIDIQRLSSKDFSDAIALSEILNKIATVRNEFSFDESLFLSDTFSFSATDNFLQDFNDAISLVALLTKTATKRKIDNTGDLFVLSDTFSIQYGIIVNGGIGSGSYNVNDVIPIIATIPFNHIFIQWVFNKLGIANIYDPNTTITIPSGGGVITAKFLNLGTIKEPFLGYVVIMDLNDFEYVLAKIGDIEDTINTVETIKMVGSSVGTAKNNFTIEQGSVFERRIIYKGANGDPVDLTGYTAEMDIRQSKKSSDTILELTTSNGLLTLGGVQGTITINIPANTTDALDFTWGEYDLELYPSGDAIKAIRLLEGKINLSKQVTR